MKDALIFIAGIVCLMALLAFVLGTVWVLFFAMSIGNTFAAIIILIVGIGLMANLYIYYKEEIEGED